MSSSARFGPSVRKACPEHDYRFDVSSRDRCPHCGDGAWPGSLGGTQESRGYLGETIRYKCQFKDFDDAVVQPTTHTITVTDPSGGTVHRDSSPTWGCDEPAVLYGFHDSRGRVVGNYKIVWKATYGSNSWVVSREFAVEAP